MTWIKHRKLWLMHFFDNNNNKFGWRIFHIKIPWALERSAQFEYFMSCVVHCSLVQHSISSAPPDGASPGVIRWSQPCQFLSYWREILFLLITAVSATRWNVELLKWEIVFKLPFCIQMLWKAEIWTEYSYELVFYPIWFSVA